jgi:hypothetical protein
MRNIVASGSLQCSGHDVQAAGYGGVTLWCYQAKTQQMIIQVDLMIDRRRLFRWLEQVEEITFPSPALACSRARRVRDGRSLGAVDVIKIDPSELRASRRRA